MPGLVPTCSAHPRLSCGPHRRGWPRQARRRRQSIQANRKMPTLQLVDPFVENHDGAASQRFSVARRVPAQRARVDLGLGKLNGVPNQPALNALRLDLDVELQAEELRSFSKGLEWALRGKCEIVAARRKSEIIT